jgi:hypothetical protein
MKQKKCFVQKSYYEFQAQSEVLKLIFSPAWEPGEEYPCKTPWGPSWGPAWGPGNKFQTTVFMGFRAYEKMPNATSICTLAQSFCLDHFSKSG